MRDGKMFKLRNLFMQLEQIYEHQLMPCIRRDVKAALVSSDLENIILTGRNTPINGICRKEHCYRENNNVESGTHHELCFAVHAEQEVLCTAASRDDMSTKGLVLICTTKPCSMCARLIDAACIDTVYYTKDYPDEFTDKVIANVKTKFVKLDL
jgi:dCMP deaminase